MIFELKQIFQLESARSLPLLPEGHPCQRIHGHSFKVTLTLRGPLDPKLGWLIDFNDIKSLAGPVMAELDHRYLNDIQGLENPTSELLCVYIYDKLKTRLPILSRVTIQETPDTECSYPA